MHHEDHIYATITDIEESGRPTPSITEDKCDLKFRHKISIVLIVFLGNVLHKQRFSEYIYVYIWNLCIMKCQKVKHKT